MKIHAALMTQNELFDLVPNVTSVLPFVDSVTIVDGGSDSMAISYYRNWCAVEPKLRYFIHPWEDNFPKQRNNYLARVGEIASEGDWVLAFDPDEYLMPESLAALRNLAEREHRHDRLSFRCRSVSYKGATRVWSNEDDYWKGLLFRWSPQLRYVAHGKGQVHESLEGLRRPTLNVPHFYEHRKQENVIWPRGARNYFMGGGGPNLGSDNPRWVELRAITSSIGIETWQQMWAHLVRGSIDGRLRDWILRYRHETGWDGSSEQREWAKTYFRLLHPEEEPAEMRGEHIP